VMPRQGTVVSLLAVSGGYLAGAVCHQEPTRSLPEAYQNGLYSVFWNAE